MVIEIFHWLWLAVLLGSAVALRTTSGWRPSVARHTSLLVDVTILAAVAELVWRIVAPPSVPPLASWAAALFFLSVALSALDRHLDTPDSRRESGNGGGRPRRDEQPYAEDPFRAPVEASDRTARGAELRSGDSGEVRRRLVLEQTAEAVALTDLDGELDWVNPAWTGLHGYQAREVSGHHLSLFFKPDQMRQRILPAMAEARKTGSWTGDIEHRGKDGSRFTTRMSLSLLQENGDTPVGYVAVARRVESSSDAEPGKAPNAGGGQEAETLRVLAGSVAHEFNNILTGILGNASLLSQQSPPGLGDEVRDIETASKRAAELSRLLQAYTGKEHPTVERLDLSELVRASAAVIEEAGGGRARSFELAADLPSVSADPAQIVLLVSNLVANARDAVGPEGGEITLRTGSARLGRDDLDGLLTRGPRAPGVYAFLEVADTGHGMDEATRSRIFEPFFTTRSGRRGLGLTAVAGIVHGHRGAIGAAGAPGQGTRVRVYFPAGELGRPRDEPAERHRPPESAPPPAQRPREAPAGDGTILVIDNEKIIRDLACGVLSKHGFSVLTAADGEPALELYRRHQEVIRAVLLDLSMPLMGGEEVFRGLRSIDPGARVILMTGHDTSDVLKSFDGGGLAGILQKPFMPEELIATLDAALA